MSSAKRVTDALKLIGKSLEKTRYNSIDRHKPYGTPPDHCDGSTGKECSLDSKSTFFGERPYDF